MAYEFKKLSEVEALNEVPDGANALVEVGGEIKRVPGNGLGGAGGIATAIIKSSDYDSAVAGVSTYIASGAPTVTYSCINMTYEEARQILTSGQPLAVMMMYVRGAYPYVGYAYDVIMRESDIKIEGWDTIYWTPDEITDTDPTGVDK